MNMKVFIYAYEDSYYGLHGINTQLVCEVRDIDEAREIGLESAYEVIDMYSDYLLEKGDILMSHINSVKHLAKTAIFESNSTIIHGMNLLCMRVYDFVNPTYIEYFFKFRAIY